MIVCRSNSEDSPYAVGCWCGLSEVSCVRGFIYYDEAEVINQWMLSPLSPDIWGFPQVPTLFMKSLPCFRLTWSKHLNPSDCTTTSIELFNPLLHSVAYESVDDKSLSKAISQKTDKKIMQQRVKQNENFWICV